MPIDLLYVVLGGCVGLIVGLTGVGGGSLMTPALVLLFNIHPGTAVGTDLLYAAMTKSAGTLVHALRSNVAWRVVGLLSAGSVPAAIATLVALSRLGPHNGLTAKTITIVLGFALLLTILTGAVIGFLVSTSSVGAGAIGVTALLLLYPTYSTVRIVGTDIAHAVPLTLMAGAGHWLTGSVDMAMLLSLLVGSIPGIVVGSHLAPRAGERSLRYILALALMVAGGRLAAS